MAYTWRSSRPRIDIFYRNFWKSFVKKLSKCFLGEFSRSQTLNTIITKTSTLPFSRHDLMLVLFSEILKNNHNWNLFLIIKVLLNTKKRFIRFIKYYFEKSNIILKWDFLFSSLTASLLAVTSVVHSSASTVVFRAAHLLFLYTGSQDQFFHQCLTVPALLCFETRVKRRVKKWVWLPVYYKLNKRFFQNFWFNSYLKYVMRTVLVRKVYLFLEEGGGGRGQGLNNITFKVWDPSKSPSIKFEGKMSKNSWRRRWYQVMERPRCDEVLFCYNFWNQRPRKPPR